MTSPGESQALNGNADDDFVHDTDDVVIQDPKPKGYGKAYSKTKHALTAQRIIDKHYTVAGVVTLRFVQNAFWHWNGSHYVEWEHYDAKLFVIRHLNVGVVPRRYNKRDSNGVVHTGYELVDYDAVNENITCVVDQLKALTKVDALTAPCWLDGAHKHSPGADEIAPMANGLLHMPTGRLLPPTPLYFCTRASTVAYDVNATECPEWIRFLDWMFGDDTEAYETQEEIMAYCMVGSNKHQKAFFLSSPGRGGKGTRMDVLGMLVGDGAIAPCDMSDFSPNKEANLHKCISAAVMYFDEPVFGSGERAHAAAKVKAITGGSPVAVRRLYKGQWMGVLPCKIIMTGNEQVDFHDSSGVIVDRIIGVRSEADARIKGISGEPGVLLTYFRDILMPEMPGILNRMVVAYARLDARGHFIRPKSFDYMADNMSDNAAPTRDFILSDMFERHPEFVMETSRAYDMYKLYIDRMGRAGTGNQDSFAGKVNSASVPGVKAFRIDIKVDPGRKRMIRGIRPALRYDAARRAIEAPNMIDLDERKAG